MSQSHVLDRMDSETDQEPPTEQTGDEPLISNRRRVATALATATTMLVIVALGTRGFHTNDDSAMASIASGGFTGTPDARWVFVDPTFSVPVTLLYRMTSAVAWYGLSYYLVHVLAMVSLFDVLRRRSRDIGRPASWIAMATIIAVEPRFLLMLSFTTTAFMAALASVVLIVDLTTDGGWAHHWFRGGVSILLLVAAISIRTESALAVLVVATPVLATILIRRWRDAIPIFATLSIVIALNRLLVRFFTDVSYRSFLEYNKVRGGLHGTPRISRLEPDELERMGWDTIDRSLFGSFFFDDGEIFSLESLEIAASSTGSVRAPSLAQLWDQVLFRYPWLLASVVIVIVLAALAQLRRAVLSMIGLSVLAIAAMGWLESNIRLPERVALPMWTVVVVLASVASLAANAPSDSSAPAASAVEPIPDDWHRAASSKEVLAGVWSVVLVTVVWAGAIGPFRTSATNRDARSQLESQLTSIDAAAASDVVIAMGASLRLQGTDPLQNDHALGANPRILSFGWPTFSPMFEQRKANVGVVDPMRDILVDPNVVFFTTGSGRTLYQNFLARETTDIAARPLLESVECTGLPTGHQTCIWKLDTDTPAWGPYSWSPGDLPSLVGSVSGDSRIGNPRQDDAGYVLFGPYVHLSARRYRLTIEYRSDESVGASAGVVDVARHQRGDDELVVTESVAATELTGTGGEPGSVSIEFMSDRDSLWEFRVWWDGKHELSIDEVRTEPLD